MLHIYLLQLSIDWYLLFIPKIETWAMLLICVMPSSHPPNYILNNRQFYDSNVTASCWQCLCCQQLVTASGNTMPLLYYTTIMIHRTLPLAVLLRTATTYLPYWHLLRLTHTGNTLVTLLDVTHAIETVTNFPAICVTLYLHWTACARCRWIIYHALRLNYFPGTIANVSLHWPAVYRYV